MRARNRSLPVRLLPFLLLLAGPGSASAADLSVSGATQYYSYTDPFRDDSRGDLVQYLKLSAPSLDNAGRFSAHGYGRASLQFGGSDDPKAGDSDDLLGRLYYLYLNYALPGNRGDVRLGRQFVSVGAGAGTVDGVRVDVRKLGPVSLTLFAGLDVYFAETTDRTHSDSWLVGASAGGSLFGGNHLEVSYLSRYDLGDPVREIFGFHADQRFFEKATAYFDYRYDYLHDSDSEILAGVQLYPFSRRILVTGEYYSSYPTFDADTIYTAFAVTRYWEALGRVDWVVSEEISLFGAYTRSDYDGPDANTGTLGIRARPKRIEGLGVKASVDLREGYPGDRTGFRIDADYRRGKGLLAGGVTYDVFQRDSMTGDFSGTLYWIGGRYELRKNLAASVRLEDKSTWKYADETQARVSLNYSF